MTRTPFDAIVIGGGITGAGVLRDLALRGYRGLLLEKEDLGAATTASSSHLIHGGLRYLLYDRLTTHATCWDSGHITRIARPLLTRLPILWPVYRDHRRGLETVETLLESYDSFQPLKEGKKHLRLSALETRRLMPGLKEGGLLGGLLFDEYWVDAVNLVKANTDAACRGGAEVRLGATVIGFKKSDSSSQKIGVRIRIEGGKETTLWASVVINAAGPWANEVASLAGASIPLRHQKGSHLVYDHYPLEEGNSSFPVGLLLEAIDRERYVFILPGKEKTLVGPTDIPAPEGIHSIKTTEEEVSYLLNSCRRYFSEFPASFDRTVVGARPLLGQRGPEKLLSRGFRVVDHGAEGGPDRFVTVAGGKMSDFRLMGEETVTVASRYLEPRGPCRTAELTLEGTPVACVPHGDPPPLRLKTFLDAHPRLREFHALAYLGGAYLRHAAKRIFKSRPEATVLDVIAHYKEKT